MFLFGKISNAQFRHPIVQGAFHLPSINSQQTHTHPKHTLIFPDLTPNYTPRSDSPSSAVATRSSPEHASSRPALPDAQRNTSGRTDPHRYAPPRPACIEVVHHLRLNVGGVVLGHLGSHDNLTMTGRLSRLFQSAFGPVSLIRFHSPHSYPLRFVKTQSIQGVSCTILREEWIAPASFLRLESSPSLFPLREGLDLTDQHLYVHRIHFRKKGIPLNSLSTHALSSSVIRSFPHSFRFTPSFHSIRRFAESTVDRIDLCNLNCRDKASILHLRWRKLVPHMSRVPA